MLAMDRKAAAAAYKERKVASGIYCLRCSATGQAWVGRAPDVETIGNRLRFALEHHSNLRPSLKAALKAHGSGSITFEVLERFEEDDIPYERNRFLKERQNHWRERLGAETI